MQRICVFGAGGHAAVVIQALRGMGHVAVGCYDDRPGNPEVLGVPVLGSLQGLRDDFSEPCVIAIGANQVRQQLAKRFACAKWKTAIHPSAIVDVSAKIEPGAVVLAGAIVQARAYVGMHVIINTRSVVDHDCEVEAFGHIAQGAVLGGGVKVGEGALVGLGAAAESGVAIDSWQTLPPGEVALRSHR